ncbi:MAG: hypothetical protein E6G21_09210 [Actinobacteria bacterium]|nr:MAG: hypothetical protein E6G21_09210 [Actinomycetota bacterium]
MDERLDRWLQALVATPGLTAIRDLDEARRVHVEESLGAVEIVRRFEGAIVDVGSGGGAPGIPLAAALPERAVVLLEANGRKCAFLRETAREFPNVTVVRARRSGDSLRRADRGGSRCQPRLRAHRRRSSRTGSGVAGTSEARADATGFSAPPRYGEEASSCLGQPSPVDETSHFRFARPVRAWQFVGTVLNELP